MTKNILTISFILISFFCSAKISLPYLISNGMVLQRDSEIKIWGWASPSESVTLRFNNNKYRTVADENGDWAIKLPAQKAGGPYSMLFNGENELVVGDILFGDVWLCTGQSNMTLQMERVKERYPDEVANDHFPEIRNYFIRTTTNLDKPQSNLPEGQWESATKGNILGIAAVPYFFAKDLYNKYHIPIGIINASVGGTPIQSWISEDGFSEFAEVLKKIEKNKDEDYRKVFTTRPKSNGTIKKEGDKGLSGAVKWYENDYIPKGWNNINVPGYWEDQGVKNLNGAVWYRKDINIPASMIGVPAKIFMGRVIDADFVYVNGVKVGNITYQYPPRRYEIPSGLLKEGKNTIVVRVINYGGKGGFVPDKPYFLTANGEDIDLKGTWQYKVGEVFIPSSSSSQYSQFWSQSQPTSLYNAMVAPVRNQKIKGVLWYQGETNSGNPKPYEGYLKALISDYRTQWNDDSLPFIYVQLPNYKSVDYLPSESNWAEMRDAQLQVLSVDNTAMAIVLDAGEWNDIHPLDKKTVGKRLALGALKVAYGEDIVHSGPVFKSAKIVKNKIVLSFDFVGGGLASFDEEPLCRFEIAGEDKRFMWADADIVGDRVVVHHESITSPKYVKYAWADNPLGANLYNKEGLPASPFRNYNPKNANNLPWQGKKGAVVLTYDDALHVHLDNAIPLLDSLGLKGTFYLSTYASGFRDRVSDWKVAAKNGHEMGNHTLFHPCDGDRPNRDWVNPNYDMSTYTMKRMVDEIKMTNTVLEALDGGTKRTFAFTCGDMKVEGQSFMDQLQGDFVGARAVRAEMHQIDEIDLYNMDCYMINGESGEELIALAQKAIETNSLMVFLFHGVGGEHSLDVSLKAHRELLNFLKQNENDLWTTTMLEVVENIEKNGKR